jgi:hypothetical protein
MWVTSPLGRGFESHPARWRHTLTAGEVRFNTQNLGKSKIAYVIRQWNSL